jgi:hypothetical protein
MKMGLGVNAISAAVPRLHCVLGRQGHAIWVAELASCTSGEGAAGGLASEVARTEMAEGRLPTRVVQLAKIVTVIWKVGATGAAASAAGDTGAQAFVTGHVELAQVGRPRIARLARGLIAHGASLTSKIAGVMKRVRGTSASAAWSQHQPPYLGRCKPEMLDLTDSEIERAFFNRKRGSLVNAPADSASGSGPKLGTSQNTWYCGNLGVPGDPGGRLVNSRVHSEIPRFVDSESTLQVDTCFTNNVTQGVSQYMTQKDPGTRSAIATRR